MSFRIWKYEHPILSDPILRELIAESSSVFRTVQSAAQEELSREDIIQASRQYRAILHANYLKFDEKPGNDGEASRCLVRKMSVLWHLVEILFLDAYISNPRFMLPQLLVWIRWHEPEILVEHFWTNEQAYKDESYWPTIKKLVILGESHLASCLLKKHPQHLQDDSFTKIAEHLERMPVYSGEFNDLDFDSRWTTWSKACKFSFDSYPKESDEKVILGLISGDFETYQKNKHLFSSWYHMMVSLLLYNDPMLNEADIAAFSKDCYENMYPGQPLKPFDSAIISLFNYELVMFFKDACAALEDSSWFAAHMIDLLHHGNIFDNVEIDQPKEMREFFLLDYGSVLTSDKTIWELGISYLVQCPKFGFESLRLSLEHVHPDNQETAEKLIESAEALNLDEVVRLVSLVMSQKFLSKKMLGPALLWAAKSKSPVLASHIADIFLSEYVEKKNFPDESVFNSLNSLMLTSDRLTFLVKYQEFIKLRENNQNTEAASLIESLISSRVAPKFFTSTLINDAIPLLEAESINFDKSQTFQMMAAFEDFFSSTKNLTEEMREQESLLSLALSRNVARSIII